VGAPVGVGDGLAVGPGAVDGGGEVGRDVDVGGVVGERVALADAIVGGVAEVSPVGVADGGFEDVGDDGTVAVAVGGLAGWNVCSVGVRLTAVTPRAEGP
jgi:hypothetical protein